VICTLLFAVLSAWLFYIAIKALSRWVDVLLIELRIYFDARKELQRIINERKTNDTPTT
jgi:hypothetical protein